MSIQSEKANHLKEKNHNGLRLLYSHTQLQKSCEPRSLKIALLGENHLMTNFHQTSAIIKRTEKERINGIKVFVFVLNWLEYRRLKSMQMYKHWNV